MATGAVPPRLSIVCSLQAVQSAQQSKLHSGGSALWLSPEVLKLFRLLDCPALCHKSFSPSWMPCRPARHLRQVSLEEDVLTRCLMCRPFKRAKAGEISAPASPDSISAADHQMLHTRTDAGVGAAEPSAKIVPSEAAPDPNKAAFAARSRLLEG